MSNLEIRPCLLVHIEGEKTVVVLEKLFIEYQSVTVESSTGQYTLQHNECSQVALPEAAKDVEEAFQCVIDYSTECS